MRWLFDKIERKLLYLTRMKQTSTVTRKSSEKNEWMICSLLLQSSMFTIRVFLVRVDVWDVVQDGDKDPKIVTISNEPYNGGGYPVVITLNVTTFERRQSNHHEASGNQRKCYSPNDWWDRHFPNIARKRKKEREKRQTKHVQHTHTPECSKWWMSYSSCWARLDMYKHTPESIV